MGKFKWSEDKIRQLQGEGRGKGTGADYRPWVEVADFSSRGRSRRVFSRKTGREHHFFSDVEWHLFLLLEFADDVVDIREQYPLKRDETLSIAARRCIKHPTYPGAQVFAVMTTDFLVTRRLNGRPTLEAYSCKRSDDVENLRTLEKLEIERTYFAERGVPFHLTLHTELPESKIRNLEWCRQALTPGTPDALDADAELFQQFCDVLATQPLSGTLTDFCHHFDVITGRLPGSGLRAARALLWNHTLRTDFHQSDLARRPVSEFQLTPPRQHVARA